MRCRIILLALILHLGLESQTQVYINEFLASNIRSTVDTNDYLKTSDWIELYNSGSQSVDLSGYYLTDDNDNTNKWEIPSGVVIQPNGYFLFWADGYDKRPGDQDVIVYTDSTNITIDNYHLNFKLSSEGEFIGLYSPSEEVIDTLSFGMQASDISYGRRLDNINQFAFMAESTPLSQNSSIYSEAYNVTPEPVFSIEGGMYPNSLILSINHSSSTAQIYYTTDGSIPSTNSNPYTSPINIGFTQSVRVRAFDTNQLPSNTITETYIIGDNISLPVLAISTSNDELWSFDFGIFQKSLKNREIPINIEYFDTSGVKQFGLGVGMKIFGTTIFQLKQKPMSIEIKGKYGSDLLEYKLFNNKELHRFKNFSLRNGGNDYGQTHFLDGLVTGLVTNKMEIDYQSYQPTIVFVNGSYWGIYNLREKLNDNYLTYNHNLNPAHLNIIEDNGEINRGNVIDYQNLIDFARNNDLSDSSNYEFVKSKMDINEYINYQITKMYIGYWLADLNNKYWNGASPHEKWRWILFDLEHSFGRNGSDNCQENTLSKIATINDTLPEWSTVLLTKLMANDSFKYEFIQRTASYLNTIFKTEKVVNAIDSLSTILQPEIPRHINRWSSDPLSIPSHGAWIASVNGLRSYAQCRPNEVKRHLMEHFSISDTFRVNIRIPSIDSGKIFVNNVLVTDSFFSGTYFSDVPLTLRAVPGFGYKFSNWLNISNNDTLVLTLNQDTTLTPIFSTNPNEHILPEHIMSDTVLSISNSPYVTSSDLIIDSNVTMTIESGVEILMQDQSNIIVHGKVISNGSSLEPVRIVSNPDSKARVPYYSNSPRWGAFCLDNATDTTRLNNTIVSNTSFGKNILTHRAAVSSYNSHLILDSIQIIDAFQPFYSEYGSVQIFNSSLSTRLSTDVINIKYADSALVKDCTIKGNDAEDTDAIDYDQISRGAIVNNKIFGFLGFNSDGIDLGEGSTNILIEGNKILNCSDKGISVGQASSALIEHNIIYNCAQGVGVKDSGSFVNIDHNTFYQNDYAVASFEKNLGKGGGSAFIQNSILSNSNLSSIFLDTLSNLSISYSLSNTDNLSSTSTGMLFDNPSFINAGLLNFQLQTTSPCIDAGNPMSPLDSNNSITDMGAYHSYSPNRENTIIINEINYNSLSTMNSSDWIELYNYGLDTIDMSRWIFMNKDYSNTYILEDGITLPPDHFLILCRDTTLFSSQFPSSITKTGNFNFNLRPTDQLRLFTSEMELVCLVAYQNDYPWSDQPDGKGSTLELDSTHLDFSLSENWHQSNVIKGTPGKTNSEPNLLSNLFINEFLASNTLVFSDAYGEYEDWIEIYNANDYPVNLGGLYLTDNLTQKTKWQIPRDYPDSTTIPPKGHFIFFADKNLDQGILHLDFQLRQSEDEIGLVQISERDTIGLDEISFSNQIENHPYGRYPDGNARWDFLFPTPNAPNRPLGSLSANNVVIYPNPARDKTTVLINDVIEEEVTIEFFNLSGQLVANYSMEHSFNESSKLIDLRHLESGTYILKIRIQDDTRVEKFVKMPIRN